MRTRSFATYSPGNRLVQSWGSLPGMVETALFIAIALVGGWGLMAFALRLGEPAETGPAAPPLALAMWVPGLAAILVTRLMGLRVIEHLKLNRLGWPDGYLVALMLPQAFALAAVGLTIAVGAGRFDGELTWMRGTFQQTPGPEALSPDRAVLGQVLAAMTVAPLINLFITLGSELGWRGYLLPRLMPLGRSPAIVLVSLLWWLWQLPLVLGSQSSASSGPSEAAVLLVWCLLFGTILSWLYFRTESPWAPALACASLSATANLPLLVLVDLAPGLGGSTVSPLGCVAPALFVIGLLLTGQLHTRTSPG